MQQHPMRPIAMPEARAIHAISGAVNGSLREFLNPNVSRAGLDRCLRRCAILRQWSKPNGECMGNLRDRRAKAARPKGSAFKACEPGYLHVDVKYLPQMADGAADRKTVRWTVFPPNARRSLFVAIDRATRWVFIRIFKARTAANARPAPSGLNRWRQDGAVCATGNAPARSAFAPFSRIEPLERHWSERQWRGGRRSPTLLGLRKLAATGAPAFDHLCAKLGIEHRLTPPASPRTNGLVERFNGRIEAVLQGNHIRPGEDLETTLRRYALLTNQQRPQSALGSKSPLQAMRTGTNSSPSCSENSHTTLRGGTPRCELSGGCSPGMGLGCKRQATTGDPAG
jgi:transposase InsO family protein